MSADHAHVTPEVIEKATAEVEAQHLVAAIAEGRVEAGHAWSALIELERRHGSHSAAAKAFVIYLAKQARRAAAA